MPRVKKRRTCRPPKTVSVRGHWRITKGRKRKRRRKAAGPPKGHYWVVSNGAGRTCGHHHRTLGGAHSCSTKKNRAERAYRARHGMKMPRGGVWLAERRAGR